MYVYFIGVLHTSACVSKKLRNRLIITKCIASGYTSMRTCFDERYVSFATEENDTGTDWEDKDQDFILFFILFYKIYLEWFRRIIGLERKKSLGKL